MAIIKSTYMNHNTKIIFFTKIVTFIILSWIYQCTNHEKVPSKTIENGYKVNISFVMRTHRLLAKHEYQNEIPRRGLHNKVSYNRDNYKLENGKSNNNTFQQLKQDRINHVDEYLKCYRNRYSKKFGLKKLDCYYEKLLFGSFNKINKIVEHKKATFVMPKTVIGNYHGNDESTCRYNYKKGSGEREVESVIHTACKKLDIEEPYIGYIYASISMFISLSLIIYTYIKILKYYRIKAGMLK
ncbi:hypothetical protein PVNG_06356 [Plasmodium vivax North Korean]|uniref:Variable surface protein n=1 Tax=Plasmodium vivax North Korean TaxID=1035514 RepID=A0A0J9W701_PLAVI|nr:hypothetical protein PVNG_06356 [Plasmodium vivax North Korean]